MPAHSGGHGRLGYRRMALQAILKVMRPRFALLAFITLLLAAEPAAHGQSGQPAAPLRVNALRSLEFGLLIGGVESTLTPTDGRVTAEFEILGTKGATVSLLFTLPSELVGESGQRLALSFGSQSAAYSVTQSGTDLIAFDPRAPFSVTLPIAGRVVVVVGGTAKPSQQLISGRYTGNLSLSATTP